MDMIFKVATWLIPLVIAIVFHEVAHGWTARYFGDPTAQNMGRLTLNPIRHVDPIGTVVLPMILAISGAPIFGWAKPVPVVAQRMRNPRWNMVAVALAGPGMNLVLATVGTVLLGAVIAMAGQHGGSVAAFLDENLQNFIIINVMLAVFNLLPVPGFDGSHVVEGLLPRALALRWRALGRYAMLLPILLFVLLPTIFPHSNVLARLIGPPIEWVLGFANRYLGAIAGG
jgi:Zn-dependent protease